MSDVTDDDDLRDVFRLLYEGDEWDEWDFDDDMEGNRDGEVEVEDAGGLTVGDEKVKGQGVEARLGERQNDHAVAQGKTVIQAQHKDEGSTLPTTQERYTRKRFLDSLASLLAPSAKRTRIYNTSPPSPPIAEHQIPTDVAQQQYKPQQHYSPSLPSASSTHIIPSTSPLPPLTSPTSPTYAPFSPLALLARLRTFRPSTFPALSGPLDAVSLALRGWRNTAREEVSCVLCLKKVSVRGVADIRNEGVRNEVVKRMGEEVESGHARGCAWGVARSPDSLVGQLRRMVHSPIASSLAPLALALEKECELGRRAVAYNSPLSDTEIHSLSAALSRHTQRNASTSTISPTSPSPGYTNPAPTILATAAALALFAWYPYHPNAIPGVVPVLASSPSAPNTTEPANEHADASRAVDTDVVQCRLCERRVGLWTFRVHSEADDDLTGQSQSGQTASNSKSAATHSPPLPRPSESPSTKRSFDLMDEHLDWCPIRHDNDNVPNGRKRTSGWWSDLATIGHGRGHGHGQKHDSRGNMIQHIDPSLRNGDSSAEMGNDSSSATLDVSPVPTMAQARDAANGGGIDGGDGSAGTGDVGPSVYKSWVTVSDKLERKPWRR